jgi:hypothetical protein
VGHEERVDVAEREPGRFGERLGPLAAAVDGQAGVAVDEDQVGFAAAARFGEGAAGADEGERELAAIGRFRDNVTASQVGNSGSFHMFQGSFSVTLRPAPSPGNGT